MLLSVLRKSQFTCFVYSQTKCECIRQNNSKATFNSQNKFNIFVYSNKLTDNLSIVELLMHNHFIYSYFMPFDSIECKILSLETSIANAYAQILYIEQFEAISHPLLWNVIGMKEICVLFSIKLVLFISPLLFSCRVNSCHLLYWGM